MRARWRAAVSDRARLTEANRSPAFQDRAYLAVTFVGYLAIGGVRAFRIYGSGISAIRPGRVITMISTEWQEIATPAPVTDVLHVAVFTCPGVSHLTW